VIASAVHVNPHAFDSTHGATEKEENNDHDNCLYRRFASSPAVCDYAAGASLGLEAPLDFPACAGSAPVPGFAAQGGPENLSGNIGLWPAASTYSMSASLDETARASWP